MLRKVLVLAMAVLFFAPFAWASGESEEMGEGGDQETATLRVPMWPDIAEKTRARIEAFQEDHPNIEFEYWETDPEEYRQQIFVQLAGGAQIDALSTNNNAVYAELASRNMLEPIDRYIEEDNFDTSYLGPYFEATKINGKSYGLPTGSTVWALFYNKDLFDEAGVSYPTDGMTWEEFYEKANAVSSGSGSDKTWGAYFHTWPINWMGPAVQTGATPVDEDLSPFADALRLRKRLTESGAAMSYFNAVSGNAHYSDVFWKGNTAMVPIGNWFIGMMWENKENYDFDWDIVEMPVPEGVQPGTTWGMAAPVAVGATTENADAAWEYVKFVSKSETSVNIRARDGEVSFNMTPDTKDIIRERAEEEGAPENIEATFDARVYPEYPAVPDINYIVNTIFKEEAELYFSDEKSLDQAIADMERRIRDETE